MTAIIDVAMKMYRHVIVKMGAQMGKTEAIFNYTGYRFDFDPTPAMYVGPTQKQAESISSDRFMKMIRSVPALWDKIAKGRGNKISEKFIAGVRMGFAWAGSATELASHPVGLALLDEYDRMEDTSEGDPLDLLDARISTYADGTLLAVSTPTIQGASKIDARYQGGTKYCWHWPCPDCKTYFVPQFKLLKWPEKASPATARENAFVMCPACGSCITDDKKGWMNEHGVYARKTLEGEELNEDASDLPDQEVEFADTGVIVDGLYWIDFGMFHPLPGTVGSFWVSGLCSPWRSFGARAEAYVRAVRDGSPGRVQAVINTGFGELFKTTGDAPEWAAVAALRQQYESGVVPKEAQILTCGVDVQKNRLVYAVRGWGPEYESWLVEHGEVWGATDKPEVWQRLGRMVDREWGEHKLARMMVDSGYRANEVYAFCRQHRQIVFPTKGHDTQSRPYYQAKVEVSIRGKIVKGGQALWHFDSDYFKSWVHGRIEWPAGEPGAWHLPKDATDDYCQQIVAEGRVLKPSGRPVWVLSRERAQNHYLDAEALNALAAHILQVHTLRPPDPAGRNLAERLDVIKSKGLQ